MEKVLLFLKSHAEPWLSFSSVYLDTVPSCILLIVVGLLLLCLCYLLLPTKRPGRAKRRQKGGTFRGWRSHRRKTEETRKLLSILKSALGHHHGSTPFRHMLCPEPSCEVCNRTTAEIQQLLFQGSLQDAALSQYFSPSSDSMIESSVSLTSDLLAIAPGDPIPSSVPEPSPSPCSTLSTNLDTSFEDLISPSNLPPKPTPGLDFSFPGGHFPTQPLGSLPPPPCPGQGTDPVLQGITVTLGDSICGLPTHEPKTKTTQSPDVATSEIWPQGHTKNLPISNWAQGDAKQNILALNSSKAPIGVDREANLLGNLLFLSPDALALLERQVRKRGDFLIHREREKTTGYFSKQHRPDVPLHSPGKMLESISVKHDSAVSLPRWNSKGKPQEMHLDQQSLYSKTFEGHLQKKCIQLPWDRPVLHHDFLYPTGLVSGSCSSTLVVFSSVYDTSTAQEPPEVPDPQAQESPELPDPQDQDSPELPDPQDQDSPELPDLQFQESSTVPDPQAQESPELPDPQPLLEPEIQIQPLPQDMPQPQSQVPTENQPQSSVPVLPPYSLPQISTSGVGLHEVLNEAEALLPSETQHLEHHLLKKKQENLWGLPSVVCKSQKDFCPPTPNLSLVSQCSKPHISISILPGDFALNSELREKLEHHLLKRLIQNRWGLPCKVLESLFLINPQRDGSESKSNQDLSGVCLFKGQISKDVVDLGLSQPGSFYKRTSEMLPLEKDVRKSQRPTQDSGLSDHLMSDSGKSSDMDLWSDSEEDLGCQVLNLSGNNSKASWKSLNEKQLENDLKADLSKKVKEIKESPIHRTPPGSQHSIKKTLPLSEKSCRRGKQKDSVPLVSRTSNVNTANEISFLCSSNKKMLEYHIKSFHLRMIWGLPKKVLDSIEVFKMKEELAQCIDHYNFPSSANLISEVDSQLSVSQSFTDSISLLEDKVGTRICDSDLDHQFPATSPVHKPYRGSSTSLHGHKVGTRVSDSSLDRSFPTTSLVHKPYRGSSISLHGDKVGTRVCVSDLDCPFPATSPVCKPSRKSSVALHGHKVGRRVSVSSLDHSSPATSPVREPYRGSSISLHGNKVGTRVCVSDRDHPFPATSPVCKPNRKSSVVLQGHKVGRRVSLSNLDHPFPVTSPVCKPCRGNSLALLGDKIGRRTSVPGLDHTSPATSSVCKPHRANSIALLGDRTGRRISDFRLDCPSPLMSPVCKPCRGNSVALLGDRTGRVSHPRLDCPSPPMSPVCKPHRANSIAFLGDRMGRRVSDPRLDHPSPPTLPVCKPCRGNSVALLGDRTGKRVSDSRLDRPSSSTSPVCRLLRGSPIFLHGDKVGIRISVSDPDRPSPAPSPVNEPYSMSCISLHGDKVRTRVSDSSLYRPAATSLESVPCRGSSISLHGGEMGRRISVSSLDHHFPVTSPVSQPYRGSCISLHGDKLGIRISFSDLDRPFPLTSHMYKPYRGSSIALHGDKVRTRVSDSSLDRPSPATSPVCMPCRGSSIALHGDKVGTRVSDSSLDRPSPATSPVCMPCRGSSIALHGDKVGTRVSDSSLDRPSPATSPVCMPCRGSSISFHGDKVGIRISAPGLDHDFPATSPVCKPYRGSSMSFLGNMIGKRMSVSNVNHHFPATSTVCKCYRGSSISLQGDKVGTRISNPDPDGLFPVTSPVCKPYRGTAISLHGDKVGTRLSVSGLDRPFPPPSPVCKPYRGNSISLHGDKVGTRLSIPGLDRPFPPPSPVSMPCRRSSVSLHGDKVGTRLSVSGLDRPFPPPSPVCKPCRGSSISLHGDKVGTRLSIPGLDRPFPPPSPVCKPYRGSSISLHGDKVGTRLSIPGLDRPFPPPSPVCKPYRGNSISLHGDNVGTRLSIPGLDRPFPPPSPVSKPCRRSSVSLHGDKVGTRLSIPGLDRPFPPPSPVCRPCRGSSISLHGDKVGTRLSVSGLDHPFSSPSPVSKPCRGGFTALHGDKVGTGICATSMDHHSSATSPVCKKRQGILRKMSCDITYERIDDIQRLNDCRQHFLPCTDDAIDKGRQKPPALANRCSPALPRRQIMAGPEPSDITGISRNRTERLQGKHFKNLEHFPTGKKSVEIFRARERCAIPSPCSKTLTTNEPKCSPVIGMTLGEKRTMLTSKHPPPKISEPRNSKLSGVNTKLLCELKLNLDNTDDSQTHDHSTDRSKCKSALTYTQGTHTRHMADSQVWHVHVENTGISREQIQEPDVPVCVLRKDQDKNLPAASKTVSPPERKPEELGGGDAGLGPSQPRRRIHAAQDGTLKDMLESKYSPTQPLKGQPPAESHFRKRMKHFLQWIWPSRRCEGQNRFLEQGCSLSPEQSRGPGKNQATWIRNTEVQPVKPASGKVPGKVPGKKLGQDHGTGKTCHQVPLSTQVKFSKTQQQAELQLGAAPVQGHPFNHRVTSCKGTSTKSCRQEAAFAGQSYPARNTHMKHRDREPKKVVPFRDQLWCQRYPSAVSQREPVPHPNPACRCQFGQRPWTAVATAGGS